MIELRKHAHAQDWRGCCKVTKELFEALHFSLRLYLVVEVIESFLPILWKYDPKYPWPTNLYSILLADHWPHNWPPRPPVRIDAPGLGLFRNAQLSLWLWLRSGGGVKRSADYATEAIASIFMAVWEESWARKHPELWARRYSRTDIYLESFFSDKEAADAAFKLWLNLADEFERLM